jgi:hypothetical protein
MRGLGEGIEFRLRHGAAPFGRGERAQRCLALVALEARRLVAERRRRAVELARLRLDLRAVERRQRHRVVGQHGAALGRRLGEAAGDEDAVGDGREPVLMGSPPGENATLKMYLK